MWFGRGDFLTGSRRQDCGRRRCLPLRPATPRPRRFYSVCYTSRRGRTRRRNPMSADCLFCKIAAKKIPSKIVYEDPDVFAFEDISPQAPTHILICPRKHFESLTEASTEDQAVLGKLQLVAAQLARERSLLAGYRTVLNNGTGAVQSFLHLHFHLLAVPQFRCPPG